MELWGKTLYLDEESSFLLTAYDWYLEQQPNGHIYFMSTYVQQDGTPIRIKLHRLIAGATCIKDGIVYNSKYSVDHKNRDTLDNTKDNLRLCTKSQNAMNSKIPSDNTSGYKGVSWKKDKRKWKAYLTVNKKQIHLGYFSAIEDAAKARINGARLAFGEFFAESVEGVYHDK